MIQTFSFQKSDLTQGVNFLNENKIIVLLEGQELVTVIENKCQHMNGKFVKKGPCVVECPQHNWLLNLKDLTYDNPLGVKHRTSLSFKENSDGEIQVSYGQEDPAPFWKTSRGRKKLQSGEFGVSFYAHACIKVSTPVGTLFTDPWLVGPAFTKGWWLVHTPPEGWLQEIAQSSGVYLSHNHSDHMNEHTLKLVARENSKLPIFIPKFENSSMQSELAALGFQDIRIVDFHQWQPLGEDCNFMILPDSSGRHDSGLLFEYKGHRILSTVDCANCCDGNLPTDIDVLLSSFAGGASGFPVCWPEQYSEDTLRKKVRENRMTLRAYVADQVQRSQAKAFIPYAGYFSESHPMDADIKKINKKNSATDIKAHLAKRAPGAITHLPFPGDFFDLKEMKNTVSPVDRFQTAASLEFQKYEEIYNLPEVSEKFLAEYFSNLPFRDDFVLNVSECSDDFSQSHRDFFVDFRGAQPSVIFKTPEKGTARILKMRVRQGTFSYVLKNYLPWEELSIGFQARFSREPDVYNFEFWNHMQNFVFKKTNQVEP